MLLITIITENGSYKKYKPTKEEVIDMFSEWLKYSVIKSFDFQDLLKLNLKKWNMENQYNEILISIKRRLNNE